MSTSVAPSTAPVMQAQAALPTGVAGTVVPPAQQAPASISSNSQAALIKVRNCYVRIMFVTQGKRQETIISTNINGFTVHRTFYFFEQTI